MRIIMLLLTTLPLLACAQATHPVAAPTGIKAESGGGEQQLGVTGVGGTLRTTVVR